MAASSSGTLEWQATHGGKRQRAAAKRELGDRRGRDGMIYSRLVEVLLDAWAYEELSAAKIQKIVAAARDDGLGSSHIPRAIRDEILGVATIGDEGRIPGNCNRDLMRRLHIDSTPTFETTEVSVPFQDQEENLRYADTEVVFPHDVIAQLACFYESEFFKKLGTPEQIHEFWEAQDVDNDPKFYKHPVLGEADYSRRAIPIKIHSDSAVMTNKHSLHVLSWTSFLNDTSDPKFLSVFFAAFVKQSAAKINVHGDDTMHVLCRIWAWSFAACLDGHHPTRDWANRPWPAGSARAKKANQPIALVGGVQYIVAVIGLCADLEELCNEYRLSHFNSLTPCFFLCACDSDHTPWTDVRDNARWRKRCVRLPRDGSPLMPPNDHPIWTIPGLNIFNVLFDMLHMMDLGVSAHVIGNVLDVFLRDDRLGPNQDARLSVIWSRIREMYKRKNSPTRLGHLTASMFKGGDNKYPQLSCKGNECRHLLPVILDLCHEYHQPEKEESIHRLAVVTHLCRIYGLAETTTWRLGDGDHAALRSSVQQFLSHYSWLAARALEAGHIRWQFTVKFHYMAHLPDMTKYIAPKWCSTYPFESFVGKIAKTGRSASYGKAAFSLGRWLAQKIVMSWAVHFRRVRAGRA